MANIFHSVLEKAADLLSATRDLDKDHACVISNFNTQSVGNRKLGNWIKCNLGIGKAVVSILLAPDFMPARNIEDSYNGEVSDSSKSYVGNFWENCRNHKAAIPHKEITALIAYMATTLYTGSMLSGESGFKASMLIKLIAMLNPKSIELIIALDQNFKYTVTLSKSEILYLAKLGNRRHELALLGKLEKPKKTGRAVKPTKRAKPETLEY